MRNPKKIISTSLSTVATRTGTSVSPRPAEIMKGTGAYINTQNMRERHTSSAATSTKVVTTRKAAAIRN